VRDSRAYARARSLIASHTRPREWPAGAPRASRPVHASSSGVSVHSGSANLRSCNWCPVACPRGSERDSASAPAGREGRRGREPGEDGSGREGFSRREGEEGGGGMRASRRRSCRR